MKLLQGCLLRFQSFRKFLCSFSIWYIVSSVPALSASSAKDSSLSKFGIKSNLREILLVVCSSSRLLFVKPVCSVSNVAIMSVTGTGCPFFDRGIEELFRLKYNSLSVNWFNLEAWKCVPVLKNPSIFSRTLREPSSS